MAFSAMVFSCRSVATFYYWHDFCHMGMRFPGRPEVFKGGYHVDKALRSWTCAFLLPWGIQARVVRFSRLALCHERSCGTDVAICKI